MTKPYCNPKCTFRHTMVANGASCCRYGNPAYLPVPARQQPLKEPVRKFEDTFSAETVVMDHFFSGKRTRIISVTEPGYDVALFFNEDGGAEAVISRPGMKPTGVNIAPPGPGRQIGVERTGEKFEVVYKDKTP